MTELQLQEVLDASTACVFNCLRQASAEIEARRNEPLPRRVWPKRELYPGFYRDTVESMNECARWKGRQGGTTRSV